MKHVTPVLLALGRMVVFPSVLYFLLFCLLTFPLITRFSTHLFGDEGDGLQNVWNVWWVNEAVMERAQSPWHTDYVRFPHGTSLLGHTVTAFNGFLAIPLLRFMTLLQICNVLLIFTFVAGGLTAFLLAYHLSKSYWPSLLAGCIFTFSNYHFAHAEGHLNLSSIEWIPLFILLWYMLMLRPRIATAVSAALVLFLVLICEYNFFFYCVLAGLVVFGWNAVRLKSPLFFIRNGYVVPLGAFSLVSLLTSGALVVPLILLNRRDPLIGGHPPKDYSMDLLAPFIPGGHWRFAGLTEPYWSRVCSGNIHESSVHLGLAVVILLIYAWHARKRVELEAMGLWFSLLILFAALSLGPELQAWGRHFLRSDGLMPYAWLEWLVPPLKVSGVPVRMAIMMTLGAAIISAGAIQLLWRRGIGSRLVALSLLVVLAVEHLPKPIPTTDLRIPEYVRILKDLPEGVGVWDTASTHYWAMFYQTYHKKPIPFGYLSRVPMSVFLRDLELLRTLENQEFEKIWRRYRLRYLVVRDGSGDALKSVDSRLVSTSPDSKLIFRDGEVRLFDLAAKPSGREAPASAVPLSSGRDIPQFVR